MKLIQTIQSWFAKRSRPRINGSTAKHAGSANTEMVSIQNQVAIAQKETTFEKPKILLIDAPPDCLTALRDAGLNVQRGSFGHPYPVMRDRNEQPVIPRASLPNYTEQEVIVIDLSQPDEQPLRQEDTKDLRRNDVLFLDESSRLVDPRPLAMTRVRSGFDRILRNGGIFIIFAQPREEQIFRRYEQLNIDNWSFLSVLNSFNLRIQFDHGQEMTVLPNLDGLGRLLEQYLKGSQFTAVLTAEGEMRDCAAPVARNKYGRAVSLVLVPVEGGLILIFPQLAKKAVFLKELLLSILPSMKPELFPDLAVGSWTSHPEYELPGVLENQAKIKAIQEELERRVEDLKSEVLEIRKREGFIHDLVTQSGDRLVTSVKAALEQLGFKNVRTIDDEADSQKNKQEDLQIDEGAPLIVCEVKGIAGLPTEDDIHQVVKYINRRMKELQRTDIRGLVVINHQRHIPPLERRHAECFTEQQIADAASAEVTLVSTWDIFRLLRGKQANNWPDETVKKLFFANGRLEPVPSHYEKLGTVERTAPKLNVIGIRIQAEQLSVGETLAIISDRGYWEFTADSLEINKSIVQTAKQADLVGVRVSMNVREKTNVWRVGQSP